MLIALFVAIGLVVGVALDILIGRLAWTDEDGPDDGEPVGRPTFATENGSLVAVSERSSWQRRLVVMAATAGLFALTAVRYEEPEHLAVITAYVCVLLLCAGTDLISFRVPNVITYPAILAAIVIGVLMPDAVVWKVLAGGALAGGALLLPALLTGGMGMGMGDVKLAAFVGLAIGVENAAPAMLIMALGGGIAAAFLLITRLRSKGEPIPYAPFIAAGSLAVLFWRGAAFVTL